LNFARRKSNDKTGDKTMAKSRGPLQSVKAHGTLNKTLTYQHSKTKNVIRKRPIPKNTKSNCQLNRRQVFLEGSDVWKNHPTLVPDSDKILWEALAKGIPKTGYNLFMSEYLSLNLVNCEIIRPSIIPKPTGATGLTYLAQENGLAILQETGQEILV